jgi:hypothetical protein
MLLYHSLSSGVQILCIFRLLVVKVTKQLTTI